MQRWAKIKALPQSVFVSGRWVLAHRATPRAWTEKGTTGKTPQQRRNRPHSASVKEKNENNVLDEPFLVSADFFCYSLPFLQSKKPGAPSPRGKPRAGFGAQVPGCDIQN